MAQMLDNGGTPLPARSQGIRETLLTVTCEGEAEDVLVRWQPGTDRMEIEDHNGAVRVYSRTELLAAVGTLQRRQATPLRAA